MSWRLICSTSSRRPATDRRRAAPAATWDHTRRTETPWYFSLISVVRQLGSAERRRLFPTAEAASARCPILRSILSQKKPTKTLTNSLRKL